MPELHWGDRDTVRVQSIYIHIIRDAWIIAEATDDKKRGLVTQWEVEYTIQRVPNTI